MVEGEGVDGPALPEAAHQGCRVVWNNCYVFIDNCLKCVVNNNCYKYILRLLSTNSCLEQLNIYIGYRFI